MGSSFMGLYVQRDGLGIAQKALDITGNNLTNTQTDGYSRQRIDVVSVRTGTSTIGYNTQIYLAGAGSEGEGVTQLRDPLLDNKFRKYTSISENLDVKVSTLKDVEDAIDDIETTQLNEYGTGFSAALQDFKAAWQSFSSTGTDQTDIANVAQGAAETAISILHNFDSRIDIVANDTLSSVESTVTKINTILENCGNLNKLIKSAYVQYGNIYDNGYGLQADTNYGSLELKDQMNGLLDELSQYCDISSKEETEGTFTICISGVTVVQNDDYAKMTIDDDTSPENLSLSISEMRNATKWKNMRCTYSPDSTDPTAFEQQALVDEINSYLISGNFNDAKNTEDKLLEMIPGGSDYTSLFNSDEITDRISEGDLRGYIDVYNGKGVYADETDTTANTYQGIPYYKATFDALATSFADAFNSIYEDEGYSFRMFDFDEGLENTAAGLKIADSWYDNPLQAVHPKGTDEADYDYDEISNKYINKILSVFEAEHSIGKEPMDYTFENFVIHYGNTIGTQIEDENTVMESADIMLQSVEDSRDEVMAVSSDEEGVNMLTYQKWYNAMARMLTAIDDQLDKLINGTGRVGL